MMSELRLTAAALVRVVRAVHVVVALLVFPDALTVRAGELIRRTAHCETHGDKEPSESDIRPRLCRGSQLLHIRSMIQTDQ